MPIVEHVLVAHMELARVSTIGKYPVLTKLQLILAVAEPYPTVKVVVVLHLLALTDIQIRKTVAPQILLKLSLVQMSIVVVTLVEEVLLDFATLSLLDVIVLYLPAPQDIQVPRQVVLRILQLLNLVR